MELECAFSIWDVGRETYRCSPETFKDRRLIDADFVLVGHAAILHHDFPARLRQDGGFAPVSLPVARHYLYREGVSDKFVAYIKSLWPNFVAEESAPC